MSKGILCYSAILFYSNDVFPTRINYIAELASPLPLSIGMERGDDFITELVDLYPNSL
jgi:hypothetical protein